MHQLQDVTYRIWRESYSWYGSKMTLAHIWWDEDAGMHMMDLDTRGTDIVTKWAVSIQLGISVLTEGYPHPDPVPA